MKENYLERAFKELVIFIMVHFMKENSPWCILAGAENLILVHFLKENYLERHSKSWKSLFWCIL